MQQRRISAKIICLTFMAFAVVTHQSSCFLSTDTNKLSIVVDRMKIQVLDQGYKILSFSLTNKCTNQIEIDINTRNKFVLDSKVNYQDTIIYMVDNSFTDSCGDYEIALYVTDNNNSIFSFYKNIHISQMGYVIELEAERK